MKRAPHIAAIGLSALAIQAADAQSWRHVPIDEDGKRRPAVGSQDMGTAAAAQPPEFIAHWQLNEDAPTLPVFDATVEVRGEGVAIVGGFSNLIATTQAIQIRDAKRGWLPIGSQMIEPRAGHTMTPLGDGRVLIVGGVQGTLGGALVALDSCEVLDPYVAGSQRVAQIEEPMIGHTAHALDKGRAAIAGGNAVHLFDAGTLRWTGRFRLQRPRWYHAAVLLTEQNLLLIGGEGQDTVEQIPLDDPQAESQLWEAKFPVPLSRCAAVQAPDGRVIVVGGVNGKASHSSSDTWLLDPASRTIEPWLNIRLPRGVASPAVFLNGWHVVILGGEWIESEMRGPANAARMIDLRTNRLWSLPPLPNDLARRMWFRDLSGMIVGQGGYRFTSPEEAEQSGAVPGVTVAGDEIRLDVGRLTVPSD